MGDIYDAPDSDSYEQVVARETAYRLANRVCAHCNAGQGAHLPGCEWIDGNPKRAKAHPITVSYDDLPDFLRKALDDTP